jgi:spore photoproduct lyase
VLKPGQRPGIPASSPTQTYYDAKSILVVRVRKASGFASCKPSAHYQLPLSSSCPGLCEYCYLQTRFGPRPYVTVYANIEEILNEAARLVRDREPEITAFEGSATSDPLSVERITGSLGRSIEFFGAMEHARFKFVTKFADVAPILGARHAARTTVRFSVNAASVIRSYEHHTAGLAQRLEALCQVRQDGYPVGVMIGPVIIFDGWKCEYRRLLTSLAEVLNLPPKTHGRPDAKATDLPFEIITHRFTSRAKSSILSVFPGTSLPMNEDERRLVHGQFGYTKFLYPRETIDEVREFFASELGSKLPAARIEYVV